MPYLCRSGATEGGIHLLALHDWQTERKKAIVGKADVTCSLLGKKEALTTNVYPMTTDFAMPLPATSNINLNVSDLG